MSRRLLTGTFVREADVLGATEAARTRGYQIVDVFSPYAIHGLDRAMGLAPSRLTWACFAGGVTGLSIAVALELWTSAVDWPLDVGGKPLASLPAFVPVAFELTILLAGLTVVAATFLRCGLVPGRRAELPIPRVTDDRFAVVLLENDAAFSASDARALFEQFGAVSVAESEERDA